MARTKLEDAESRILSAALSLFARHGTERVNSNTIARRARLGVGTFYGHFADKYAVLHEIELRTLTGLRDARVAAVRHAGPEPSEQVRHAVDAAVRFAKEHPEAYRVTFGRERAGASKHGPVVSESSRPVAEALRTLQQAGRIPTDLDADLAGRAYLAMEVGMLLWWLEDQGRASVEGIADTLVRMHPAMRTDTA